MVSSLLSSAGFRDLRFESLEKKVAIAKNKSKEELVDIFSRANPTISAMTQDLSPEVKTQFIRDLENTFEKFKSGNAFEFPTAVWVVHAVK